MVIRESVGWKAVEKGCSDVSIRPQCQSYPIREIILTQSSMFSRCVEETGMMAWSYSGEFCIFVSREDSFLWRDEKRDEISSTVVFGSYRSMRASSGCFLYPR